MQGCDAAFDTRPIIPLLGQAGYSFVERYIGAGRDWKRLQPPEVAALKEAGINLISVVEEFGGEASIHNFGPTSGERHWAGALADAQRLGQPEGSAFYFAVDLDPSEVEISSFIIPYFSQINTDAQRAGSPYLVRSYGSGLVGLTLRELDLIDAFQLAGARGWSGFAQASPSAVLVQGGLEHFAGRIVDTESASGEELGAWWSFEAQTGEAGATQ